MIIEKEALGNIPVRWGILGPGWVARGAIMPAFATVPNAQVIAVASRDRGRAQTFATDFQIPRAYAGYDLLIDDPEIEAIYLALPNGLHAEWAIRAAEAGKHVLCEKPLAVTAAEAQSMVDAAEANGVLLMEALMYRFHPRLREALDLVQSGAIGTIQMMRASFCFMMTEMENYRQQLDLGGGALLDVGSYGVNAITAFVDETPISALALGTLAEGGVDDALSGSLLFPSGTLAQIQCSFRSADHQSLDLTGSDGTIELSRPFTSWRNDETALRLSQADQLEETIFPAADPYALMLRNFSDAVRDIDDPLISGEESIITMRALDALRRSMVSGRTERI